MMDLMVIDLFRKNKNKKTQFFICPLKIEHVLLTHIPHPDNGKYSTYTIKLVVDIPDINCEKCSLQLLSVMTDKIGKGNCCSYPTDSANKCFSVYHTCANIKITGFCFETRIK